jgi:integrase
MLQNILDRLYKKYFHMKGSISFKIAGRFTPRSLYQTRHTFATLMLDAGEHPGWVQKMMGHDTMQMIYEKYYSYIQNYERDEGSAFMEKVFNSPIKNVPDQVVISGAF